MVEWLVFVPCLGIPDRIFICTSAFKSEASKHIGDESYRMLMNINVKCYPALYEFFSTIHQQ
jgi:hypothetical protein